MGHLLRNGRRRSGHDRILISNHLVEKVFKALSSHWRREILQMVCQSPLCQCEIEKKLPIDKTNLSRHVKALKLAGLITEEIRGTMKILHLRDQRVIELIRLAEELSSR